MRTTGRVKRVVVQGRTLHLCNQRCTEWGYPYDYRIPPVETLSTAGCGIFSIVHAIEWMRGVRLKPETLAAFSCANGGRGDDGTDRPALLRAMMASGMGERFGFAYDGLELRNDLSALQAHLSAEKGVALCNLRVGHIVMLCAIRKECGEWQALAVDSYSESMDTRLRENIRECQPDSEIVTDVYDARGACIGQTMQYAVYWAKFCAVRDFNILLNLE